MKYPYQIESRSDTPSPRVAQQPEPLEGLTAFLCARAAEVLDLPPGSIDAERPLAVLGLDSLSAVNLQGEVEAALGVPLPLADLLAGATVRELAERLLARLAAVSKTGAGARREDRVAEESRVAVPGDNAEAPLSPGQRALWFLERLAPEAGAYNIVVAARAHGLDVVALRHALERLVVRHPALRTVFLESGAVDGEPIQRVLQPAIDRVDLVAADAASWSERQLRERLAAEAWRPFDLARGPLLRVRVFARREGEPVLLLAVHHLVADFSSLAIFARELGRLYRGEGDAELPELAFSHVDFVHAQEARLAGREGERLAAFWGEALSGVPDLALPTDRPRPPVQTWRGLARNAELPAGLAAALRRLAAAEGATLFTVLLAAWQIQLGRYAGQDDFAVGTPTAGRGAPDWAAVLGYFVNPVALRADLAGDPTFGGALARTRRRVLAALEHAGYPFVLLAERLRPLRDPARTPLFQVLFSFQQGRPGDDPGLAAFALGREGARISLGDGLALTAIALPERRARFELSLAAAELPGGGIGLSLEANADLFDATTAERMLGQLRILLEAAAEHPCARLSELPLLSAAERQQALREWNDTAAVFPEGARLTDLVAAQAARTPDAVAVVGSGGERLTYGALRARALGLAALLRAQGIGPESRVGLCLPREPDLVVAILGILEAGGAYVPLDPAYPGERLERMLADSGAELLLTVPAFAERFGFFTGPLVLLEEGALDLRLGAGLRGGLPATDRNLAYVIYTSGSTGRPKGVGIEHRSAVTLVRWALGFFSAAELAGVLAATSVCFDLSVFEIFAPLAAGGRVILAPNVLALPAIAASGAGDEITLVNTVPSPMSEVMESGAAALPPGLRTVNLAGEALPPELAARLHARPGIERVVNLYGPSEDTTYSTGMPVPRGAARAPIGRPLANTRARVLGRSPWLAEPLPVGVPGELVLAGEGLARGYLGQPERTAERFLPDPWGAPGARMYRTGDRARLLPDGEIDFLGRWDDQVKIRGFRVEPGEVEAVLAEHPGVREAVVLAVPEAGERRLVAFIVPIALAMGKEPPADLRDFLAGRLLEAMIPTVWRVLPALPRNTSGKIDRAVLARTAAETLASEDGTGDGYSPPANPTEELLAGLWAGLLGIPRVGRHDDFFALGGHSLLATRTVAQVSRLFGVDLPVSALFAAPTVERLAARIAAASPHEAAPPIVAENRRENAPIPLSFAQRRLWFLEQLLPDTAIYNLPGALRLAGPLDVTALAVALAAVVRRHSALRTVFQVEAGEPTARVTPGPLADRALPVVDLARLAGMIRAAEAARLEREEARRPFGLAGLARGPLLRTFLVRLGADEHLLLATLHHLAADGWSLGLFLDDLAALYAGSSLPKLPVEYSDFAAWQARWLSREVQPRQLDYWRERLADLPVLALPTDRPRPAVRDSRGARRRRLLPALESGSFRSQGVTLFMALLGAFQALLARLTGEARIPVGSPVANRRRPEVERLVGLFVNTLVLDVRVDDDPLFSTLLARVREACLGAYAHQDLPFERLVEALRPDRGLAQSPLFQVLFVLEEPLPARQLGALALEPRRGDSGTAKLDLVLAVSPLPQLPDAAGWELVAEYAAALWEPATIDRLLAGFGRLLEAGAADPGARLSALPLLSAGERQQLLVEWNDTARSGPRTPLVHERIAEQARRRPAALAVASPGERLTYGELEERSGRLARRLRALGVGPEVRVALCAGRSAARVVGALAVWKAGGAFVSLDPEYPRERLAFVVDDAQAPVLLTEERFRDRMPDGDAVVLCLDLETEEMAESAAEPAGPFALPAVAPENLAYLIYTSGSTGWPKGVATPHACLSHLIRWYQGFHGITPEDRGTQIASPAFDASILEVWPLLAAGASVHLPDDETRLSAPGMLGWWAAEGITLSFLPTPLAEAVLAEAPGDRNQNRSLRLRTFVTGGDRLHRRPRPGAGFRLINIYGPTEYSVLTTAGEVSSAGGTELPRIGRPIDDTRLYLLDRRGIPAPAGVPGEVHIAGHGLARGYHGRPDWTAERFLPDPWSGEPGARMYRTGDLARLPPDGELDFIGRVDHQVKVRGVRIELGEIEATLAAHPGVREAVVLARGEGEPGGLRLVAYIVAPPGPSGATLEPAELRSFLAGRLPEPMVPAFFVFLAALPVTANGKIDRRALPAPERQGEGGIAPRNRTEERVAGVFREVLGLDQVGVDDDFFALGGHSLLATRAAFRLAALAGVQVPVAALFEAPTVAGLAEWLERSQAEEERASAPGISPGMAEPGAPPLSLAQRRLWFLTLLEPGNTLYNLPIPLRLEGRLDVDALGRALAEIVRRHEPLRTVYAEQGGEPAQVVLPPPVSSPLARVALQGLPEPARQSALEALLAAEERLPFDLEQGPVARFRLVELEPEDQVLIATFHHIATDGWSMGIFARELGVLYAGSSLPELPLRYVDFARRERRELERGTLSRQLDFWRERLAGIPVLELPADRRPPHPGPRGAGLPFDLPPDLAVALSAFGRNAGLTPFLVLLAGFAALLARLSGQDDFGIGVPSAGRNRAETAGMIGFFVNTLVLRPELGGDPAFGELARRLRDLLVAAQAHEEVPFERLVEELQPERAPGLTPFFQAMFAFLQDPADPAGALSLPGLQASLIERDPPLAEFDLTLSIHEWEGRLRGVLQYRTDLFDASTVARWGGHLRALLTAAAADPGRSLAALPLLSAAEIWQLKEWNGEPLSSLPATLHQRFEEQALRTPDAVALIAGESALSYGELERGANRLARHLLALGIMAEDRIAVCLPRSPELDLVLLAVLKSGGIHLPLDPSYPPERMRIILEDAGARVLVSRAEEASRLPLEGLGKAPERVLLDRDAATIARRSAAGVGLEVDPRALAYIIYTSGSTGRPKGVGVPHGAAVAHVDAVRRAYGIGPCDRALQFSSPGFDVSIEQVLVALASGAALIVRGDDLWSPHELTRRIGLLGLTYMDLPTAYWHRWASDPGEPGDFGDFGVRGGALPLRVVVAGGEEMLAGNVRQWMRSPLAAARLWNGYGPTEVVVTVTLHEVRPEDGDAAVVPLGRPVQGNSVWVLDRAGNPQPPGVPGEICVGGPKARGYLSRPELTAARFVPDPFSGLSGARLYRTGDRARSRPDGKLEFLGRIDEQVKVRGFRIELGEVEAALTRHPAVRQATVLAIPMGGPGSSLTLAAWVVPVAAGGDADLVAVLRADLLRELPEYMVPTAWATLDMFPLNAHGKVDRRALPPPEILTGPGEEIAGWAVQPSPEVELLAGLYAELLGRPRVGADESFFDLGGHSLLATQLASRVRAVFGLELPLAAIFDAPTPAALALRLKSLRAARPGAGVAPPLLPAGGTEAGDTAPLSFAQQRLWFLHQLEPDDAYHVPGALRLRGPLDEAVLARAFGEIVRRHAALRTVFRSGGLAGSTPFQIVLPPFLPELPAADLSGLPAPAREAEAARLLDSEGRRPFDLAEGPLLRSLLLRLSPGERLLSVVMHHITSDAWSLGVLLRELQALYTAGVSAGVGAPSSLPELPRQYPDFARWQRRWLSGAVLEGEVAHWRQVLAGAPESLPLPYDRPPVPGAGNRGGRRPWRIESGLYGRLGALARREGWTAFMTLLAGFQTLLSRYTSPSTGQEDLVVGSPIANRTQGELEGLIGFFTNTLALRLDLAGDPAFREIGRRVRAVALDAYAHQDLPFEKLVEELAPDRHLDRNPLFQVMLVLQRLPPPPALPGVEVELVDVDTGTAKFDLTLMLFEEEGGGASGGMEYARALFDEATVDRLLVHLGILLEGAAAAPGSPLSMLPLLSAAEQAELAAWTRPRYPAGPAPPPLLVHAEVLAQAARTPDALAVTSSGDSLSYGELAARARRLARRLRARGVGPDVPVGLYLERSPDMMVAVLGVLAAGGAYLPLDPSYPAERLRTMLEDAQAPVLVTHGPLADAVPRGAAWTVRVDESEKPGESGEPAIEPAADHLAYLVYTSGSTGRPKGVAMSHGAISAMLLWQLRTSAAGAGRTLQFTSLAFDVSFQEIFSTWWAGGTLVLVAEDVRRDPPALNRLLVLEEVERLFLPFVALQQVALAALETDTGDGAFPASLREVMSAGEQLHVTPRVAALFARLPGAVLYNHYGPSETHAVTWLALAGDSARWPERPAIGGPVDHARVFLLDAGLQPVPPGVAGEVWVGGAGLARGYLGRPDLTAERFLPDPFGWAAGWRPGDRLYRTGDLARRRADGNLEFLGRADAQVKIRGHRVELGEVEAALARHPAIEQAAVGVPRSDPHRPGQPRRLTVYVVLRESVPPPTFGQLRAFLAESLPDPMVPTAWARIEALPLTATGKLDRRALSRIEPEAGETGEGRPFAAPGTPVEEMLAAIWREVLGVARVGRDDDFFALGGHSLLATQVASRLRRTFVVDLPLRRLFEARTLAELATAVSERLAVAAGTAGIAGAGDPEAAAPPLLRAPRTGDLPLSFAQERLWFLDRLQPGGAAYNIPLVLRAEGRIDPVRLAAALSGLVARHEVLRTVFAEHAGAPVSVVLPPVSAGMAGTIPVPVVDLLALPVAARAAEARRVATEESARPFDLARGPLLRALLLTLEPAQSLLFVGLHHIAADGWSLGVLVREVKALYAGESLPELPIQYVDFAIWQRRWLAGEALARQLGWWRERLAGAPGSLPLPVDHPRPPVQTQRGAELRFELPPGLARRLMELAAEEGATLFMVLLAGLFALLARLSGQKDLVVGSPIANRHHREIEGLIGFFVNTLALRADLSRLSRAATFGELLRQVREVSLGAYAHQDLPFEKLVDELQPDRDLSRSPLFQVAFALQNAPLPEADLGGVRLLPEEVSGEVAKFDLSFVFTGEPGLEAGGLRGVLQYAADLFEPPTAIRLANHLTVLLESLAARPEAPLETAALLAPAERQQILQEWNDTRGPVGEETLHGLFAARAESQPDAVAAVWEGEHLTYGGLAARAARLARLLGDLGVRPGTPVGVWMERSPETVVAVLGALAAGGHYLPLDPAWPAERAETILAGARTPVVVTGASHLAAARDLQWRLAVRDLVCLDVARPEPPVEPFDEEEVRALWDFVAEQATDRETAGGFVSSYTGLPFSAAEVDQYRDRVLALAASWLRPGARVLEIGSGAGLLLWEMAPRVARAVGLDPSALTQERNRRHAAERGFENVELPTGFAHEMNELVEGEFDLIVMASTVQFFPGPVYLERVVAQALARLAPGGALLVADVPDARQREEFRCSLIVAGSPGKPGQGRETWWDEEQFRALGEEVEILRRPEGESGFANELRFRYDVLLTHGDGARPAARPRKRLWTGWHVARQPAGPLAPMTPLASPDDLAYVIHTSGSTGEPKGIGVSHRAAAHLVGWVNATFGVSPADRLLFVTSLAFDLSVYDLFGTLAAGGTIQIAPEAALRDPDLLARQLTAAPVTIWDSAPAALQQLAPRFPDLPALASPLRLVLLSGDWIPVRLPDAVRAAFPRARVIGLGGATEATVWSNAYPIGEVDPSWSSIPYGRPLANARYHVLDEGGTPCAIGVPGDLHIGGSEGAILALGYVYQPDLTAERFLPDPFAGIAGIAGIAGVAGIPGARLYWTGDRARYGADGNLEFLGRVDHQVKIRGYRIELGEIELVLARHPGVREAVVLARDETSGEKRLVGYVVPRAGEISEDELRAFLQASLPEYMVPWAFVTLAELPVTPNGKLDREALPAPRDEEAATLAYVAPRNDLERAIGAVWSEVLGRERIGVQESFFKIGGSSLLLARLQVRLRQALGRDIPFVELFRHPTIEGLAKSLGGEAPAAEERVDRVRARTENRREAMRQVEQRAQRRRKERPREPGG